RISAALVFGSAARNELRNDSDIDVLVVGDVAVGDVVDVLSQAEQVLGRQVNPTFYPPGEFARKITTGHHFLTAVLKEPHIFIIGNGDDLGRLGAAQLDHGAHP